MTVWVGITLEVNASVESAEDLEALELGERLVELGAEGLEWQDDERPVVVVASFPLSALTEAEGLQARLQAEVDDVAEILRCEPWGDIDWSTHWREHFAPIDFGGLWVVPTWLEAPPEAKHVLRIDPSSAFGTGLHPTTALCVEAILADKPTRLLDVGTGTGILVLAAQALGASTVGVDNDPEAIRVAVENRERNGVPPDAMELSTRAPADVGETFPMVVANILAGPLMELAPAISHCTAPGGTLLLSGLLTEQAPEVTAAYEAEGLEAVEVRSRKEWALVRLQRPVQRG